MDPKECRRERSSTLEFVKRETIGEKIWVHGRQSIEVPTYYTDYFATVIDHIAIFGDVFGFRENLSNSIRAFLSQHGHDPTRDATRTIDARRRSRSVCISEGRSV